MARGANGRCATMSDSGERLYDSQRAAAGGGPRRDAVAVEEPMEVRVNGAPFAVVMRTPGADRDLAAGFLLAEDVIRGATRSGSSSTASTPRTRDAATS